MTFEHWMCSFLSLVVTTKVEVIFMIFKKNIMEEINKNQLQKHYILD